MSQTIGKTALDGAGAAFNLTSPKLLTGTGQQVVLQPGQRIIEAGVAWAASPANGTASGNVRIALYDLATNTLIPGTEVVLAYNGASLQTANVNAHVKQTGLSIDISAHAGKTVGIGLASPTQASSSGFKVMIETVAGANRNNHSTTQSTLPATFSIASTVANTSWGAYFITEDIELSATVDTITSPVIPDGTVTGTSTGFEAGAGTISTPNPAGNTTSNITFDADGDYTGTYATIVDGVAYPILGDSATHTFTQGELSATISAVVGAPAGFSIVAVTTPNLVDPTYITANLDVEPEADDILAYVTDDLTTTDGTGYWTAPEPIVTQVIHQVRSTGVVYLYTFNITEAGVVPDSGGRLKSVGLSAVGSTSVGLSSVGL